MRSFAKLLALGLLVVIAGCNRPDSPAQPPASPAKLATFTPMTTTSAIAPNKRLRALGGFVEVQGERTPYLSVQFEDGTSHVLEDHRLSHGEVTAAAFSPHEEYLYVGQSEGQLSWMKLPTDWEKNPQPEGSMMYLGKDPGNPVAITALYVENSMSREVAGVFLGFKDGHIRAWDKQRDKVNDLVKIDRPVTHLTYVDSAGVLAALDDTWTLYLWPNGEYNKPPTKYTLQHEDGEEVQSLVISAATDRVYVSTKGKDYLTLYRSDTGKWAADLGGKGGDIALKKPRTIVRRSANGEWEEFRP